jgi:hypothetical protein
MTSMFGVMANRNCRAATCSCGCGWNLFRVAGLEPPAANIESDSISFTTAVLHNSDMLSFATSQVLRNEMGAVAPLPIPGLTMTRSAGILYRISADITPRWL